MRPAVVWPKAAGPVGTRRGIALLEALIGLAVLGSAGLSLIAVLRQGVVAQQTAAHEEQRLAQADRLLAAASMLARADLDLRLGQRTSGDFLLNTSRPEPGLYRVSISEASAPSRILLVTVLYRPTRTTQ